MTADSYNTKPMSLVERKKLQWAKEREELANLTAPYRQYSQNFEKSFDRSKYGSRHPTIQKQSSLDNYPKDQERRSSLPPLYKNQYNSNYDYNQKNYKSEKFDRGGETSGYGSDTNNQTPEYKENSLPPAGNSQWTGGHTGHGGHQSGYESSSSFRDDRPKWGDKGVGVGKFWQPKEEHYEKIADEPPNWVKRGLQGDGAILVANSSPSASPEQRYEDHDRPCTGSSFSQHKCYLRGQNMPIDAVELAERERKRQVALAHQEAIRQQLEEREKRREEERIRRIREEREEELRIEREQEYERQKKLQEERAHQEKLERERRRKEAIREAMELAEKEAKLEKIRLRMMKQSTRNDDTERNMAENVLEKEKVPNESKLIEKVENSNKDCLNNNKEVIPGQKPENITKEINNNLVNQSETSNVQNSPTKSTTSIPQSVINEQENQMNNQRSLTPISQSSRNTNNYSPRIDQLAYLLQPSLESFQNFQYAVLIPTPTTQFPIAIPVNFPNQSNQTEAINAPRTENRILTPTRYRNNIRKCDSSTQTDPVLNSARSSSETGDGRDKYLREKMNNLEINYENKRRDRRSRSESMEERPKWGVNRPPTRYMKQSEKDPLYQRRKLRQKRENANKSYDEKNSSDESQTATPRHYRKKDLIEKRPSRARWRTEERIFSGNLKMYQREIVPLETDQNHLYYKCCCTCRCQKHGCSENVKVDILKIEDDTPRDELRSKCSESSVDRIKQDSLDSVEDGNKIDLLGKLSSLHNGLLQEQAKWENSPRTPLLLPNSL
ncbi:trichohyalin [Sitophilus oryzae]|uniref:Trichohyalin n=1 Tax=Sitophilus oryzae TaxID=7048 RepID=A0A6J2YRJ8_SITOR|nr:trichohyalin [Sitophilus oryzae]